MSTRRKAIQGSRFDDEKPHAPIKEVDKALFQQLENADAEYERPQVEEMKEQLAETQSELSEAKSEIEVYKQTAFIRMEDGSFQFRNFNLRATGLKITGEYSDDDTEALGWALRKFDNAAQFGMGDWANLYVADVKDDDERSIVYNKLAKHFKLGNSQTLKDYAWVCRSLDASLRKDALTFSHHKEVAGLDENLKGEEELILQYAVDNELSVRDLREYIRVETLKKRGKPTTDAVVDVLHRDKKPKFSSVETQVHRALTSSKPEDIKKARTELLASREAAEIYFNALEDELRKIEKNSR